MAKNITYSTEKVPSIQASENIRQDGCFKFDLFSYTSIKNPSLNFRNYCIIIGYIKDDGEYKYVVIPNSAVSGDDIEVIFVDQEHLEKNFVECKRPIDGIFKTPVAGDTVMCISKGRYSGVEGGYVNKVLGMPLKRVSIHEEHQVTYEDKYFVICENSHPNSKFIKDSKKKFTTADSLIDDGIKVRTSTKVKKLMLRREIEEEIIEERKVYRPKLIVKL